MSYCRLPNDSSRVNRQDIEAKRKRILKNKKYRTTCLPASNTGWGWNGVALSRLFDTIANRIATINDERRVTSGKVSQVKSLLEDWQPKQNDACEKQKFSFFFWSKRILYIIYGTAILLPSGSSRGLPLKNLLLLLVTVYQRGDDDGIKRRHTYNNIRLLDTQTFSLSLYVAAENSAKFIIPEKRSHTICQCAASALFRGDFDSLLLCPPSLKLDRLFSIWFQQECHRKWESPVGLCVYTIDVSLTSPAIKIRKN